MAVKVTFVDDGTGAEIAASEVPLEQLPESFALETEVTVGGASFVVTGAEPQTKAEFAGTGRLTVTLRRIERIDPRQLLYSLPSICGSALPETAEGPAGNDLLVLHEDDWRQHELVARALHPEIAEELAAIRRIHAEASAQVGWREIHVRERIERPLPPGLTWQDVAGRLGPHEALDGVAFGGRDRPVRGAVGARLPDEVVLWGVEQGGELTVLCVERLGSATETTVSRLKRIADALDLALVSWCRCQVYAPGLVFEPAVGEPWDG